LDVLVSLAFGYLFVEVPTIGKEMDHHCVGENFLFASDLTRRAGRERDGVLVFLGAVFLLLAQLLDNREVDHLVEGDFLVADRADAPVEGVGLIPNPLEVGWVVAIEKKLVMLGPVRAVGVT